MSDGDSRKEDPWTLRGHLQTAFVLLLMRLTWAETDKRHKGQGYSTEVQAYCKAGRAEAHLFQRSSYKHSFRCRGVKTGPEASEARARAVTFQTFNSPYCNHINTKQLPT